MSHLLLIQLSALPSNRPGCRVWSIRLLQAPVPLKLQCRLVSLCGPISPARAAVQVSAGLACAVPGRRFSIPSHLSTATQYLRHD